MHGSEGRERAISKTFSFTRRRLRFANVTVRTICKGCSESETLKFKELLEPYTVKVVRTVLRGGRGLYLKLSPLPDLKSSSGIKFVEIMMEIQESTKLFPRLETERLCLRQLFLSDAKDVFEVFSDDEVTKYYDLATFTSIERAERFINRITEKFTTDEGIRWAIALKSTNRLIGTCGYNAVYSSSRRAIVGYELKREHWGQGYMLEALHAMIEYGFVELQLNRLEAFVIPGNERSFQVLSKLGFVEEGLLREYGFWKDQFWDMQCCSLLKREWQS
jgi:[ribosomal protein S5]-alanine N-acetyltransferase